MKSAVLVVTMIFGWYGFVLWNEARIDKQQTKELNIWLQGYESGKNAQ